MNDVSLSIIIYSYLIYLSIYLYQINFMFRYLSGVTETLGLNDVYGFDDIQSYVTGCFQCGKEIILSLILLGKSFLLTYEYNLSF